MQPVDQSSADVATKFLEVGLEHFFDRVWGYLWIPVGAIGLAVVGLVGRHVRGQAGRWTYLGLGAVVASAVMVASILLLALIPGATMALLLSGAVFLLIPLLFLGIDRFAKEPQVVTERGLTRAAILAHYYVQAHELHLKAAKNDATPEQCARINEQINELRGELTSMKTSRIISSDTALLMVAPTFSQTDPRALALENSKQLMEKLFQKWKAWRGPQELML